MEPKRTVNKFLNHKDTKTQSFSSSICVFVSLWLKNLLSVSALPHRLPLFLRSSIILTVEYPFPPVGIVGAADGKNRRAFFF